MIFYFVYSGAKPTASSRRERRVPEAGRTGSPAAGRSGAGVVGVTPRPEAPAVPEPARPASGTRRSRLLDAVGFAPKS